MQTQNETTENKNPIDLNEIVFLFWEKAAADQDTPYFDFVKAHDQILMTKMVKYMKIELTSVIFLCKIVNVSTYMCSCIRKYVRGSRK